MSLTYGQHGYSRYTNGCRCEVCRAAKCEYVRARRRQGLRNALRGNGTPVQGITHGRFGYEERGCRCHTCREASAADDRQWARVRKHRISAAQKPADP